MEEPYPYYSKSKTTVMFDKLNVLWYFASLPNFWIAEVEIPKKIQAIFNPFMKVLHYVMIVFTIMTLGAYYRKNDLTTEQQHSMVIGFASLTTLIDRLVVCHYRADIKKTIYYLTVYLKEFNDLKAQQKMLRKIKCYTSIFIITSIGSLVQRGISGALQVCKGDQFVTFITIWPTVYDPSFKAEFARVVIYILWYVTLLQTAGTLLMVMVVMLAISHQFENLTTYFYELENIFNDEEKTQLEMEEEYEKGVKKGLHWHIITLWCVDRCQNVFSIIFNVQMSYAPLILIFMLPELLAHEIDLSVLTRQVSTVIALLVSLGFIMWPGGDIIVESSKLADGMYGSGWQNCRHNAVKVKKMLVLAMQQAQKPVVLKAFNIMELSYESYVSIVKASYSLFSVLAFE